MFDSGLILKGEFRCLSLQGVNELRFSFDIDKIIVPKKHWKADSVVYFLIPSCRIVLSYRSVKTLRLSFNFRRSLFDNKISAILQKTIVGLENLEEL